MNNPGQRTYAEITAQPVAWSEALHVAAAAAEDLAKLWHAADASELLFTGCGSTYYLSLSAASVANQAGLRAMALPASALWLSPQDYADAITRSVMVAVSRSGETSETLRAVDAFRRVGGRGVVAITCYPQSSLGHRCDLMLAVPAAQEESMAQTRSFTSMLLLCQALVARLVGNTDLLHRFDRLPILGRELLSMYGDMAARLGSDLSLERFFFLGNGPRYGLACEAMLKMKEMSLTYSEAYHVLEFRHGPKSMVDPQSLVVGLLSQANDEHERAVMAEM
jgi:glutamine---fructose-6-phosphate transaminase (isomerizing)